MPNKRKGEIYGIVEKLSGASRLTVMCEDGSTRNCRIPGKMKKRMWIREGDLVIVKPWGSSRSILWMDIFSVCGLSAGNRS